MPRRRHEAPVCHVCNASIDGEPASRGLLVFPRGDGVDYEEPPLCEACARAIGAVAFQRFFEEEEEG